MKSIENTHAHYKTMNADRRQQKDYVGLRSIRGIGAVLIFYHHFGFKSAVTDAFGDFGVALFFMLSGLVLSITYADRAQACNIRSVGMFMRKRLFKIYPVYVLSLVAAILIYGCDFHTFPLDVLLLQSWVPVERVYFSGNAVSWFVSSLFFAYFVFLPLQKVLTTKPRTFLKFFSVGIIGYIIIAATVPSAFVTGIIYINPVMQLPAFVLGMMIWHFLGHRNLLKRCAEKVVLLLQSASVVLVLIFMYMYRYIDPRLSLASYWWLPNFLLLAVLLISEGYPTAINRFLRLKALRFVGNVSFTFYLFHALIINLYHRALSCLGLTLDLFPSSVICLAVTIAIAYLLHRYIELPAARLLKSIY